MATRTYIKPTENKKFKTLDFDDLGNEQMVNYAETNGYVLFNRPLTLEDPRGVFSLAYEYDPIARKVTINLDLAKAGYLKFLKATRKRKLEELDSLQVRAMAQRNEKKVDELEELKQALRDMPKSLPMDKISNIFELVHLFPPILLPDE
tara:strand:+ start:636 stop:1082 length:447 start_codon:yes stop_codon:yes gene_type:complete